MTQTSSTQADSTCRLAGFSHKFYFVCKWQYFGAEITTLMVSTCGVSLSTMNYCHLLTSHATVSAIDDKNLYTAAHFYKQNCYILSECCWVGTSELGEEVGYTEMVWMCKAEVDVVKHLVEMKIKGTEWTSKEDLFGWFP